MSLNLVLTCKTKDCDYASLVIYNLGRPCEKCGQRNLVLTRIDDDGKIIERG